MLLLAGVVFCFAGEEWHVAYFCLWDISKYSANILVASAGFVKSVGAVFIQLGSSRKVAVASWFFKADAVAC
jgi:glucose-6-phosphate-specific signal transduction histidine kinase